MPGSSCTGSSRRFAAPEPWSLPRQALVRVHERIRRGIEGVALTDERGRTLSEPRPKVLVCRETAEAERPAGLVVAGHDEPAVASQELSHSGGLGRDAREAGGHGLEQRIRHSLATGREEERVGGS